MRRENPRDQYIAETFPVQDKILNQVVSELEKDGKNGIQIASGDARILQFLLRLVGAKKVVEVGTLYGFSTLAMARALPADGVLFSLDNNPQHSDKAKALLQPAPEAKRIQFLCGDAKTTLREIESKGPFDAVFIDANKAAYLDYLDWAEAHVRPGGLIVGDNTFLFDAVFGASRDSAVGEKQIQVMNEFNRRLANPQKYNSCLIPTSEGLTVAQVL